MSYPLPYAVRTTSYGLKAVELENGDIITVITGEDKKPCSNVCYGVKPTDPKAKEKLEATRKAQGKRSTSIMREQAFEMLGRGFSPKEVAKRQGISERTIYSWKALA
jgi:(p)ppGpp synthase/HD superfamily hydrolase